MPTNLTQGEVYVKLLDNLVQAQEASATLAHLTRAQSSSRKDTAIADGWLSVSELLKRMNFQITKLMQGKLQ